MKQTKHCPHCDETKPLADFYRWRIGGDNGDGKVRYQSWCKECLANRYTYRDHKKALTARSGCDGCIFLTPCRKIVMGKLTRDVVIDGVSVRIYLQPYCSPESTMHGEYKKVYRTRVSEPAV